MEHCALVPVALCNNLLDLIYSGNAKQAWRFFDEVWPANKPGKENFRTAFEEQLATSPYMEGIARLNGW